MKTKILVPVDVEEPASWTSVLPRLREYANGNDIDLTVVSVIPELGTVIAQAAQAAPFASTVPDELNKHARIVSEKRLNEMVDTDEFGPVRRIVRTGKIYSEVLKTAEEISVNLIMLMSHIPDLGDYLLGPNAAKIVRHASCSVFVFR